MATVTKQEDIRKPEALPAVVDLRRSLATPQTIVARQAMADGIVTIAAKLKDWPLLHDAVDIKIEDQREFVRWWDEHVGIRHTLNRHNLDNAERGSLSRDIAEADSGIAQQQVSRWRKSLADPVAYHDKLVLAACRKAGLEPEENHRAEGTGENEWFTPAQYIAAARNVMGEIDLDPATHPIAQQTIRADAFFTREDDALSREWHGRVWLNPPYAQPLIGQFVGKLVAEIEAGRVKQAILLTHNYTDTAWFHAAQAGAELICFTRGRIKFVDINGDDCAPTQGQAFFYYGERFERFQQQFAPFGFVMCRA